MKQNPPILTVEILKELKFKLHLHINGGDHYSMRIVTNDEWKLAVSTETDGSPDYRIIARKLYMVENNAVAMDMLKKPLQLKSFVSAYNKSQERHNNDNHVKQTNSRNAEKGEQ